MHRWLIIGSITAALVVGLSAEEIVVPLNAETNAIHFTLGATGHDVEGSFPPAKGELRLDFASHTARGEIVIDARRARTGNPRRDKAMHKKVLHSATYPEIVFSPDRIEGELAAEGTSNIVLHGNVTIHGDEHPLALETTIISEDGRLQAVASFQVPYVAWGMKNPSIVFLRVAKVVDVRLEVNTVLPIVVAAAGN